jgi:hypothetical protein
MLKKITLIAAAVGFLGATAWLTPALAQNDHYACYQSKAEDAGLKIKPKPSGTLTNQVVPNDAFSKCKFKLLCVPTAKNAGPAPANPNDHYCGWQCKGFKGAVPYTVTDQFGGGAITAKKLKFVLNACTKA